MLLFIFFDRFIVFRYQNFKTSHVIVYRGIMSIDLQNAIFQNISCYCLSLEKKTFRGTHRNFKTSHVIVYPIATTLINNRYQYFKTSHVIVYRSKRHWCTGRITFQNISCYCLSVVDLQHIFIVNIFQNISCYCLSLAFPRFLVSPLPFFPLYFLYFSIFYQPTPLSWTALLIIP